MQHEKNPLHKTGLATAAAIVSAALLAGCMSPPKQSVQNLSEPDQVALKRMQEVATAESMKLLQQQEDLLRQMRKPAPQPVLAPAAPVYDPLEGKTISVAISNGSIAQILTAFADAAQMNLIVDPEVTQRGELTNMYLKDVSLREAFNELLVSYDVSGEIRNQTIRIKANEEKFFSLNFLNINTQMSLNSGGNVFGSTGSQGNSAIAGTLSMNAAAAQRADPYTELESNLKAMLGDGQMTTVQSAGGAAPAQDRNNAGQPGFTLNRTSGTLFVRARPSQMRAVESFIKRTQDMLTKQVYIEAQLIDVQLGDGYEWGIDWTQLRSRLAVNFGSQALQLLGSSSTTLPNGGASYPASSLTIPARIVGAATGQVGGGIAYQDKYGSTVINALRSFGNLRVLSNPNIQVRNGTPAMLSVGTSQRYVARSSSAENNIGGGATTTSSEVQTDSVFSGVMVGVLPMMRDDGKIELLINPVQSEVDQQSLALVDVNDSNRVTLPKVAYKGLTTTLNVNDGDIVVVGGLIDQKSSGSNSGLPYLADVPLFGKLVTQEGDSHTSRELIVVLRVRLL